MPFSIRDIRGSIWILGLLLAAPLAYVPHASAQDSTNQTGQPPPIQWQHGPMTARLGDMAEIEVPEGFLFADKTGTLKLLELTHNIVSGNEVGAVVPAGDGSEDSWFVVFEFSDMGYVKDDEKDKINADALLKSIKEGTEAANKEREKKGWNTMKIIGWERPPYYDERTHNLTWAIRGAASDGGEGINHSLRILGRRGTMNVDMVQDPEHYATTVPRFESVMSGFKFIEGHRYADFMKGDKVAAYGLSALVLGGAGAAAMQTGLLAKFWKVIVGIVIALKKLIIVVVLAVGAFLKKMWSAITGRSKRAAEATDTPPASDS
jgi:uncharacterized membrane-anchored protein